LAQCGEDEVLHVFTGGFLQRRAAFPAQGARAGAALEEQLHHGHVVVGGCVVQRRERVSVSSTYVRARVQQHSCHVSVAVERGRVQRRASVFGLRSGDIRARSKQQTRHRAVPPLARPVQRGASVRSLPLVGVNLARRQQRRDGTAEAKGTECTRVSRTSGFAVGTPYRNKQAHNRPSVRRLAQAACGYALGVTVARGGVKEFFGHVGLGDALSECGEAHTQRPQTQPRHAGNRPAKAAR